MIHHLAVAPWNYVYLASGQKHFVVIEDTTPPLRVGDVLSLTLCGQPSAPIVRWARYIESGVGYAREYIGVELAP